MTSDQLAALLSALLPTVAGIIGLIFGLRERRANVGKTQAETGGVEAESLRETVKAQRDELRETRADLERVEARYDAIEAVNTRLVEEARGAYRTIRQQGEQIVEMERAEKIQRANIISLTEQLQRAHRDIEMLQHMDDEPGTIDG